MQQYLHHQNRQICVEYICILLRQPKNYHRRRTFYFVQHLSGQISLNKVVDSSKQIFCRFLKKKKILVGIDCSLLSSPSYSYTNCFSLTGVNYVIKMKKVYNFVSNCSRYMVQPFVLEVLMSSFERYPSWKITILRVYLSPVGEWGPLSKQKLYID